MGKIIDLATFSDPRGDLTVIEKILPFQVKRIYFIYNVEGKRGEHRHKKTRQAFVCLNGSCKIYLNNGENKKFIVLDNPKKCLIVEPEDWHYMDSFSNGSILLVLASEYYDIKDYIDEEY